MIDPIAELKVRAERLHRGVAQGGTPAIERLRALPELRKAAPEALLKFATDVQRKHCLAVVAREAGFESWAHASAVIAGAPVDESLGLGTALCPSTFSAHWNIWSASYEEARTIRAEHGGWLLAYKRHYFIVDRHYLESLGLDPEDDDWSRIGRDWARPADPEARRRLYGKLLVARAVG